MSFYVVIPARLASTRLPNKPLADIAGKPMIVRVAEQARLSGASDVIVATDHESIVDVCSGFGIRAMLTRKDHVSGTDRIAEISRKMDWLPSATVVNVQGDEPLIDPELVASTAALVSEDVPMATAAHRLEQPEDIFNPNYVKVVLDRFNRALYFSRAPVPWYRNGYAKAAKIYPSVFNALRHVGLYAFRNEFLKMYSSLSVSPIEQIESLEQLRVLWHGYSIAVHVTEKIPEAGVDTAEDLERVCRFFNGDRRN